MAQITGSDFRTIGVPIPDALTSGSEFTVGLEEGPGYLTIETVRNADGFYDGAPSFSSISSSNAVSTVFGPHIISTYIGNTTSGSLSFIPARDIPANQLLVKVASPIQDIKAFTEGGTPPIDNRFIITVKTDNAGTSASNQFTIPTSTSGITQAFNYDIETSDGQTITGLTGNHTITFPSAGTYDIYITGSFPYIKFDNGGDKAKLLDIKNFGIYALGSTNQAGAFWGCSNMVINANDLGYFGSVTNFALAWRGCSSITSFPLIDTSSGTNFSSTWFGCSSLTSFPLLDFSSGTNFSFAWRGCSSLTSFPSINISSATVLSSMFRDCFNLASIDVSGWDVSNVTAFNELFMYNYALSSVNVENWDTSSGVNFQWMFFLSNNLTFSNPLNWNTSNATNFLDMFRGNTLNISLDSLEINNVTLFGSNFARFNSVSDYDDTLISWASQTPVSNRTVNFGNSKYTLGGAAETARNTLINTYGWTIVDGGGI